MKRMIKLPYTFMLMNWAAVVAFYHFTRGHKDIWMRYRTKAGRAEGGRSSV